MTVADEARQLLADERRAQDELDALRREMDETAAAGGGHIDHDTAEALRARLEAAQERLRSVRRALQGLNDG